MTMASGNFVATNNIIICMDDILNKVVVGFWKSATATTVYCPIQISILVSFYFPAKLLYFDFDDEGTADERHHITSIREHMLRMMSSQEQESEQEAKLDPSAIDLDDVVIDERVHADADTDADADADVIPVSINFATILRHKSMYSRLLHYNADQHTYQIDINEINLIFNGCHGVDAGKHRRRNRKYSSYIRIQNHYDTDTDTDTDTDAIAFDISLLLSDLALPQSQSQSQSQSESQSLIQSQSESKSDTSNVDDNNNTINESSADIAGVDRGCRIDIYLPYSMPITNHRRITNDDLVLQHLLLDWNVFIVDDIVSYSIIHNKQTKTKNTVTLKRFKMQSMHSVEYQQLNQLLREYYHESKSTANAKRLALSKIRQHILLHGGCCPTDDIHTEYANPLVLGTTVQLFPTQNVFMAGTLRGTLWQLWIGVQELNATQYEARVALFNRESNHHNDYGKIRADCRRTYATSAGFAARVNKKALIRVLRSYCYVANNHKYFAGMDTIAGGLLYCMPELNAFHAFRILLDTHLSTYFYIDATHKHTKAGCYAASFLAQQVLRACDLKVYKHLKPLHHCMYLYPVIASFQSIVRPFKQMMKLLDFLFCFGVHLGPVLAAAQVITYRKHVLQEKPALLVQGILSMRRWMNADVNAQLVIDTAMELIITLRKPKHKVLWNQILTHTSDIDAAIASKDKMT